MVSDLLPGGDLRYHLQQQVKIMNAIMLHKQWSFFKYTISRGLIGFEKLIFFNK